MHTDQRIKAELIRVPSNLSNGQGLCSRSDDFRPESQLLSFVLREAVGLVRCVGPPDAGKGGDNNLNYAGYRRGLAISRLE